ncbi:hypothetical protein BS47DRAFT_1363793 [Hydnum rufescens UP504]|uniref:Uncharacterized protein n=1 Tax=Hydnum rufescens UP504 TaxID=1448309 RepID=A0A9P6AU01_9AGAM|nr:hypothetical protein BS47DRAFT_1363793 [Hydnum rufescens UP504]
MPIYGPTANPLTLPPQLELRKDPGWPNPTQWSLSILATLLGPKYTGPWASGKLSYNGNGSSLPGTRGGAGSAVGLSTEDRSWEYGDREPTVAHSHTGRCGNHTTAGTFPVGPPSQPSSHHATQTGTIQPGSPPNMDSQCAPTPTHGDMPKKRCSRANIKIASLNMRGGGPNMIQEKWYHINQLLHDGKLGY